MIACYIRLCMSFARREPLLDQACTYARLYGYIWTGRYVGGCSGFSAKRAKLTESDRIEFCPPFFFFFNRHLFKYRMNRLNCRNFHIEVIVNALTIVEVARTFALTDIRK